MLPHSTSPSTEIDRSRARKIAAGFPLTILSLLLTGLIAGCAGGGSRSKAPEDNAFVLPSDPEQALAALEARIDQYPKDTELRIQRAEALNRLERFDEAANAWQQVLKTRPNKSQKKAAWWGSAQSLERFLGPLGVIDATDADAQASAEDLLNAWGKVRESNRRAGSLGQIRTWYRLGEFEKAQANLDRLGSNTPDDSQERCLALIISESRGAEPLFIVRGLDQFARSSDAEVRDLAVSQLIRFGAMESEAEVSHTAEGLLVRLTREAPNSSTFLSEWQSNRQQGSTRRLETAHRKRAIRETVDALDRGRPLQAWRTLKTLLRGEDDAPTDLVAMVNQCCQQLCSVGREKLEIGDLSSAGEVVAVLRSLPQSWLGPEEKTEASELLHAHQVAAIRSQAEGTLEAAREAVDERRPDDALTSLDPLLDQFPEELIPEVQMIRARALAQRGAPEEALSLLERYGPFSDPTVQRLHGTLLASVGRGEEAESMLENLPLKYFNSEAFDGLLLALEQQRKWEKLIARLNTLGSSIPSRYREVRKRAVVGAAERLIQNRNPEGAVSLLKGNLDDEEILTGTSGPMLVRAYLDTDRIDEALQILTDENGGLETVPANLVKMVSSRAGSRLEPEARFQLLSRLPEWERDNATSEFLATNWPRYGEYIPRPGRYEVAFQIKTYGEGGEVLTDRVERVLVEWKNSYFAVDGVDDQKETWRVDGDLWIRTTAENEWWVPIRAEENPPLPEIESPDGVKTMLMEAGHTVTTKQQNFEGCLGIEVFLPQLGPDEKIRIDLAPRVGEVRWSRFIGRQEVESRELIEFSTLEASE